MIVALNHEGQRSSSDLYIIHINTVNNYFVVKLREWEGQRVDLGRSLKGHLWMVDGGWWISFP